MSAKGRGRARKFLNSGNQKRTGDGDGGGTFKEGYVVIAEQNTCRGELARMRRLDAIEEANARTLFLRYPLCRRARPAQLAREWE